GKYYNSIFTDFVGSSGAITIEDLASGEDSRSRLENGELILSNNYFWGIGASNTLSSQDFVLTYLSANNNLTVDPEIISISREANAGLDPRPHTSSPAATAATVVNDPFFNNVSYLGAFNPADGIWTENWTALSKYGFTPSTTVDVNEDQMVGVPSNYSLDQNYPNPFNPATTIRFAVPEAANVKLRVFNILGQQVAELINGFRNAGTYNINWNAENVSSGVYIYRLEAGSNVITKKMTLLK
ncbi:MAG: T9SS type A sorting domain-containing protein, partial [Bacteroidetes bacterium]|nr:T9SS type A sorting domain-containing protein [Bacteroidota bacterium]